VSRNGVLGLLCVHHERGEAAASVLAMQAED
jgi:hypothetical protein